MMDLKYPVDLIALDGRILARIPDLKGCVTDGADRDEALTEASDALGAALAGAILKGRPIPSPTPARGRPLVSPRAVIAAKVALHVAMTKNNLKTADLAQKLGVSLTEAKRLLDPRHNSKISSLELALWEFDVQLDISFSDRVRSLSVITESGHHAAV